MTPRRERAERVAQAAITAAAEAGWDLGRVSTYRALARYVARMHLPLFEQIAGMHGTKELRQETVNVLVARGIEAAAKEIA